MLEIEDLRRGIDQLQGLISNVQSSSRQMTSSSSQVSDNPRLEYLLRNGSDDVGLNDRLDQLRSLLQMAGGSEGSAEQLLMSDNEEEVNVRDVSNMQRRPKLALDSAIDPSQREVEGSVDAPSLTAPRGSKSATGTAINVPLLSGQQLKSNKEMWLEMRQQRMQREEAKNRARGRFGDGQSEDSIQESDPFRISFSTTSATYGGSPSDMNATHRRLSMMSENSRRNASHYSRGGTSVAVRYSMDSLMTDDHADPRMSHSNMDDEDAAMMQQAEEEEEQIDENDDDQSDVSCLRFLRALKFLATIYLQIASRLLFVHCAVRFVVSRDDNFFTFC